jgi:hypothetical protein
MVSALLDALHEKKTYTQFELADRLHTTPEAVMAGLEFLKEGGYVRHVCAQGGCSKKCAACPGGNTPLGNSFSVWEAVK